MRPSKAKKIIANIDKLDRSLVGKFIGSGCSAKAFKYDKNMVLRLSINEPKPKVLNWLKRPHKHIARLYDWGFIENLVSGYNPKYWILMEYIPYELDILDNPYEQYSIAANAALNYHFYPDKYESSYEHQIQKLNKTWRSFFTSHVRYKYRHMDAFIGNIRIDANKIPKLIDFDSFNLS